MVMVSIALVMSVIVTNIYFRKDTDQRVPRILRRIFLRNKPQKQYAPVCGVSNGLTTKTASGPLNTPQLENCGCSSRSNHRDVGTLTGLLEPSCRCHSQEVADDDIKLASMNKKLEAKLSNLSSIQRLNPMVKLYDLCSEGGADCDPPTSCSWWKNGLVTWWSGEGGEDGQTDPSSNAEEWVRLAKVIDRVFFWIFTASSCFLLAGLYASVPQR